jgi:alpha-tubulin suppressor-like RCC1 family protein
MQHRQTSVRAALAAFTLTLLVLVPGGAAVAPSSASAEQAGSKVHRRASGFLAAGARFSCARLDTGRVRCWGIGDWGALGYGNTSDIGDNENPGSVGPIDLGAGAGRKARAIAAGFYHACAILDNRQVRCWGYGGSGQLGYGNTESVGDSAAPGSVGPVDLGPGRTAVAITGGGHHVCAILDNGKVRCWGYGRFGQLGYGNTRSIGDTETPGSVGPVRLGSGRTAVAIAGGGYHTCAILDNGKVRCWGAGYFGQLGYGNTRSIGDNESPASVRPVKLGAGRKAVAISAGYRHTCAILNTGKVRCWGAAAGGQLGYGNTKKIGDNESPASVRPVRLGAGRKAIVISAAGTQSCAVLDNRKVRCWGTGRHGRLGYGNTRDIGDNEHPGSVGPVKLGRGRKAIAIQAGGRHTFALLDNGRIRSWGLASEGQLGYANTRNIGDNEHPRSAGPVILGGEVATR